MKKTPRYVFRGLSCPSSQMLQPAILIKMAVAIFLKFDLAGSGVTACFKLQIKKKVRQTAFTFCSGMPHPTRSLNRIVCRGQEGLKAVKTLLGVISRPILDLCYFKANVTTRNTKEAVRKSRYS